MPRDAVVAITLVTVALVAGSCGSGGKQDQGTSTAAQRQKPAPRIASTPASTALLRRLPGEAYLVEAMDMSTAKEQLGVAAGLDPKGYRARESSGTPEATFDDAALKLLPFLTGVGRTAAAGAIDHGRITAAVAGTLTAGEILIIATPQPPASITRGLTRAGFRPAGRGLYVNARPAAGDRLSAVALGQGLIVLATTPDSAAGALARTTPDPRLEPLTSLMLRTEGALRTGQVLDKFNGEDAPCVTAVAGAERFGATRQDEDLLLQVKGKPRPSAVVLDSGAQRRDILTRDFRVRTAVARGHVLALKVGVADDALEHDNAATIADGDVGVAQIYRCPGTHPAGSGSGSTTSPPPKIRPLPKPPPPDFSGNPLENAVSAYLAAGSVAPEAVKVRCPDQRPRPYGTINCTGTRRHAGRTFHYTIKVHLKAKGIKSIDIDSPDDQTKTIV